MGVGELNREYPTGGEEIRLREARLAAGLRAMDRLHELSICARTATDLNALLLAALDAAIEAHAADFGCIQLYDPERGGLRIAAQRGFDQAFLDHFAEVNPSDGSACGRVLAERRRAIIADVEQEPTYAAHVGAARAAGFRTVASTPIFAASGEPLAVLSTHFRAVRAFAGDDHWLMDILAREVARAIERTRAEIARRDSEERLAFAIKALPLGFALIDSAGRVLMASDELQKYVPKGVVPSCDPERRSRWRAWGPDGAPLDQDQFPGARVLRGETVIPGVEMLYTQDDGREIWARVAAIPMRENDGRLIGAAAVCVDIDALKRAEARQATLLHELQHRVRNILALVRSLVRRTAETGENVADVAELLDGRIGALARTQTLLTRSAGAGVELAVLVREELLAQAADNVEVSVQGPPVTLSPKAAETLALAIHELATNAAKYGAIAQGGALSVSWMIEAGSDGPDWLSLDWVESGVKTMPAAPRQAGFGTELIERLTPYELLGRGRMELGPDGLVATISFPLVPGQSILDSGEPASVDKARAAS